jgi:hypothetical protein
MISHSIALLISFAGAKTGFTALLLGNFLHQPLCKNKENADDSFALGNLFQGCYIKEGASSKKSRVTDAQRRKRSKIRHFY